MTTQLETVLAAIATDLEGIDGTGAYTNTIVQVSRDIVTMTEFADKAWLPGIALVLKGLPQPVPASNQRRHYDVKLMLLCYFRPRKDSPISTQCNSLYGDVLYAMTSPSTYTHGDTCIFTADEGMDELPWSGQSIAGFTADFSCSFVNTWAQP